MDIRRDKKKIIGAAIVLFFFFIYNLFFTVTAIQTSSIQSFSVLVDDTTDMTPFSTSFGRKNDRHL